MNILPCFTFLRLSCLIIVRFSKFKKCGILSGASSTLSKGHHVSTYVGTSVRVNGQFTHQSQTGFIQAYFTFFLFFYTQAAQIENKSLTDGT